MLCWKWFYRISILRFIYLFINYTSSGHLQKYMPSFRYFLELIKTIKIFMKMKRLHPIDDNLSTYFLFIFILKGADKLYYIMHSLVPHIIRLWNINKLFLLQQDFLNSFIDSWKLSYFHTGYCSCIYRRTDKKIWINLDSRSKIMGGLH